MLQFFLSFFNSDNIYIIGNWAIKIVGEPTKFSSTSIFFALKNA